MMNQSPVTAPLSRRSLVLSAAGAVLAATCAPLAAALAAESAAEAGAASATTVAGSGTETTVGEPTDTANTESKASPEQDGYLPRGVVSFLPAGVPEGAGTPAPVAYSAKVGTGCYDEIFTPEYVLRVPGGLGRFNFSYSETETSAVVADGSAHASHELTVSFPDQGYSSLRWFEPSRASFRFFCLPQGVKPDAGEDGSALSEYLRGTSYQLADVAARDGSAIWVACTTFERSSKAHAENLWLMARMVASLPEEGGPVAVYPAEGGSLVATPYYSLTVPAAPEALTTVYTETSPYLYSDGSYTAPDYAHMLDLQLSDEPHDALAAYCSLPDGSVMVESYPLWAAPGVFSSDGRQVVLVTTYADFAQTPYEEAEELAASKDAWLDAIAQTVEAL